MLRQTRIRLTVFYTAIFVGFLMAFIVILGIGMVWLTYFERKEEIKHLSHKIAEEQRQTLTEYYQDDHWQTKLEYKEENRNISGLLFYTVFDRDGRVVKAENHVPMLKDAFYSEIEKWIHHEKGIRVKLFKLPDGQKAVLMFTSKAVLGDGQVLLGRVYVARDVTADYRVLVNIVTVLIGVAIIFTVIAAFLAYLLAGSVMTPIFRTFDRQKQFLVEVSHELRTPLSVLLTSIDIIEGDRHSEISEPSLQILEDMQEEILKLTNIIRDLLTIARTDCGDIKLVIEGFKLKSIAEQVLRTLQMTAQLKGVELKLEVSGTTDMYADRERIRQLLFIFVDNGIKYTCRGGMISMRLKASKSNIQIVVQDTGIGIDPKYKEKVFERFFRVDREKFPEVGGNGLGLAIAKWIVTMHGGTISIQSEIGKGSIFSVIIPNNH